MARRPHAADRSRARRLAVMAPGVSPAAAAWLAVGPRRLVLQPGRSWRPPSAPAPPRGWRQWSADAGRGPWQQAGHRPQRRSLLAPANARPPAHLFIMTRSTVLGEDLPCSSASTAARLRASRSSAASRRALRRIVGQRCIGRGGGGSSSRQPGCQRRPADVQAAGHAVSTLQPGAEGDRAVPRARARPCAGQLPGCQACRPQLLGPAGPAGLLSRGAPQRG